MSSNVLVIGGAGTQAGAMFTAAARNHDLTGWLTVDRDWTQERAERVSALGPRVETLDIFADIQSFKNLIKAADLVVNFAGPYFRTGGHVLDLCIEAQTDYLDICDDADATLELLERDESAKQAGIRALIGMGSSPGVCNILVRTAVDAIGPVDTVDIAWVGDIQDVSPAVAQHVWHIFSLIDEAGVRKPVPSWSELNTRVVEFPRPIGRQTVVELSHPEPLTLPRFLPVGEVRNFGAIVPDDALFVNWALARLGAGGHDQLRLGSKEHPAAALGTALFSHYLELREPTPFVGGGLVLEVHTNGNGLRIASGDSMTMEEATGTPAAAGILLMLAGQVQGTGVLPPECLEPGAFFPVLGTVSRSTGSLTAHRLVDGEETERVRLRDLFSSSAVG